jgi:hypothetical protein
MSQIAPRVTATAWAGKKSAKSRARGWATKIAIAIGAVALVPVAALLSVALVGLAQAAAMVFGAILVALMAAYWMVVMPWLYFRGNRHARTEVSNLLAEARRFWAEAPWVVVGLGLLALLFAALATHAIVLPWWENPAIGVR